MWKLIQYEPYMRPMIPNPNNIEKQILESLSKMTEGNKKKYIADVKVMNYLLQAIPNDIYNSMDACKNAKEMWERIKMLMFGFDVTSHVRHSRLMDEFDKFTPKEGETLELVYERLTTLVNIMDRNNFCPILVSINTKFLNHLQPEWRKFITMVRHNQNGETVSYDVLYDSLVQFKPHVLASKAKKAAKSHDPLVLLAHSNASTSQSHANSSYSPQPYHVTHPLSVVDYEDEYQWELQGDYQEDKLTTAMMLLARAITKRFSTPTNNRLRTSSNTKNQAVIQELGMMKEIILFSVFHELTQLWERQMFNVITAMKKATMLVIVRNQEFMMQIISKKNVVRPRLGCDRLVSRAKVMAAPVIPILLDSSEESVGSHVSRVILFGTIPTSIDVIPVVSTEVPIAHIDPLVALDVGAVSIISPTGVLNLVDYSSSSDSDPSEDSLPLASELPLVSSFLCSDDSEVDTESEPGEQRPKRHESFTDHDVMVSRSSFFTRLYLDSSSSSLSLDSSLDISSGSSAVSFQTHHQFILQDAMHQVTTCCTSSRGMKRMAIIALLSHSGPSTRVSSPRLVYLPIRTPRYHLARDVNPLLLWYHYPHVSRSIASTHVDLLPPLKRFRDSYSPEDSREEHMEIGTADAGLGISDGVGAHTKDGIEVRTREPKGLSFMCIERDRVESLRCHMELSQEEFRQIRRDRDDTQRRLRRTMSNTRSGMTLAAIEEMINRRMAEALETRESNRNIRLRNSNDEGGNKLMKLMAKVYCPRTKIQKMDSDLWNLTVKNNDLAAYTQRFQELTMLCTKMVLEENPQGCKMRSVWLQLNGSKVESTLLDIIPNTLDVSSAIELANGRVSETNTILRGCTLGLLGQPFNIDLMLVELGSFDVIIGMYWLANHHEMIVCDEKIVRIPYRDEVLIVQVTKKESEDKSEEKQIEDVPTIWDFLESEEEHVEHLKIILELLKKEELYAKFSKCNFWLSKVQFLGHMIDSEGIQKSVKFKWTKKAENAFQLLKYKLYSTSILALPKGSENFMVYYDASHKGLGIVLMQKDKFIAYASCQLKIHEKNYTTHDLELRTKELNTRQRRWLELLSDYDYEIRYHSGKANVEARKEENYGTEDLGGMIKKLEPLWKWENITIDFVTKLPKTSIGQDAIWRIVRKVPGPEDTIKFMLNTQEFIYTVDMFQDILYLIVETPKNPFVAPVNIETIEAFINRVRYQGVVDKINHLQMFHVVINRTKVDYAALLWWDFINNVNQKKEAIQYPRFIKLIIADLMKKSLDIPQRIEEDYYSIKDDIPLVSVYTTGNVLVRGMLILDAFLTEEIRATDDFKENEKVFMNVDVPMNQPQPVVSTHETHRYTPRAHRIPTLTASPQGKKRKQTAKESSSPRCWNILVGFASYTLKIHEPSGGIRVKHEEKKKQSTTPIPPPGDDRERDKVVEATILSLTLHKTSLAAKAQETTAKVQEKLDEEEIEKMVEGDEDKESYPESHKENPKNVDDDGDEEIEKKKKDKEIENKKKDDNVEKTKEVVKEKDIVDDVVPEITFAKTNEMIREETPHLVNLAVNKDRKVDPIHAQELIAKEFATHGPKMIEELFRKNMQNTTLNLYPTTSTSNAGKSSVDLQHQLYLNMQSKPQDEADDIEI
uniref:Reverse transcriptase/retrotransposon-derived protein RNase H-like domain-containing protein n=1 Tax=Tanacetum cinerariifolium TaxID=118510 RepID=A0A6L2L4N9_TANCI|nr:hypothetical protein [Tanacetum cinerariifolium]